MTHKTQFELEAPESLKQLPIGFIDSHCHLDFDVFDSDRELVWQACNAVGIRNAIIPGVAPDQWQVAERMTESFPGLFFSAGIHPWWIEKVFNAHVPDSQTLQSCSAQLQTALAASKCVAVGECGLDAMINTPMATQELIFDWHVDIAQRHSKPLIIHCRKAHNAVIRHLKNYSLTAGGVIHGFSGSIELAEEYVAMGFYIGVGGTITYARAQKTRATVQRLPLSSIILETDAPDMPLAGHQGERNSPQFLPVIAQTLADIRGVAVTEIAQQTTINAQTLFNLHST